jgi:deoxyribose-phosphate aldolase
MDIRELAGHIDHTLLRQDCTEREIDELCAEALEFGAASVCIPPSFVAHAAEKLGGKVAVCTVIGFPEGYTTPAAKAAETRDAVENGADEIDMVINVGALKDGRLDLVAKDIAAVRGACPGKILKVIIECCLLTDEEKIRLCGIVSEAGAEYIKTSTGFAGGGATREDVALMVAHTTNGKKVKASGGIATLQDAEDFLNLGADRLGTSRVVKAVKAMEQ